MRRAAAFLTTWILGGRFTRADAAEDLMEYALLMSLIGVFAITAVTLVGDKINTVLWQAIANNF